jgi:hypothetical protein
MILERIDFISAYCDRWCEHCGFRDRCSAFASEAAAGMCGNFADGLELAVGTPRVTDGGHQADDSGFLAESPTAEELAHIQREEDERADRIGTSQILRLAREYARCATAWLARHVNLRVTQTDAVVREAIAIIYWDIYLVGAKLHRALDGRDRWKIGEDVESDPVQNDWNGSAKVASISLERSGHAWQTVADATGDQEAARLAAMINAARCAVLEEFPEAMLFIRPGFDE